MKYLEEIEKYLRNEMSQQEQQAFEALIDKNNALAKEVSEYKLLFEQFKHARNAAYIEKQIALVKAQEQRTTENISSKLRLHIKKYWRTASIAASVAVLASVCTFFIAEKSFSKKENKRILQLVNKEVRAIKKKQVRIQKDLNAVKTNSVPDYPSKGSGTAFAIHKDGYAITNLHVINGGKKVFLFTKDGKAHRCDIVLKNKTNDIAVLRVKRDDFSFSKQAIPYKLDPNAHLAERIFTLGYPKNEVVYNEGYISSLNGKDGDSTKYQLELPSSPGVSGAPVLDQSGNLIGIINSKESQSKGITYAIKSKVVASILDSLDNAYPSMELKSNSFASNSRAQQIKQLQDFVFVVKVYK